MKLVPLVAPWSSFRRQVGQWGSGEDNRYGFPRFFSGSASAPQPSLPNQPAHESRAAVWDTADAQAHPRQESEQGLQLSFACNMSRMTCPDGPSCKWFRNLNNARESQRTRRQQSKPTCC